MSLLRRQFRSLLASTPTITMSTTAESAASDMPRVPWSRRAQETCAEFAEGFRLDIAPADPGALMRAPGRRPPG